MPCRIEAKICNVKMNMKILPVMIHNHNGASNELFVLNLCWRGITLPTRSAHFFVYLDDLLVFSVISDSIPTPTMSVGIYFDR